MEITSIEGKTYINLTPHDINVITDEKTFVFKRSGYTVRLTESHSPIDLELPFPVFYKNFTGSTLINPEKQDVPFETLLPYCTPGTFLLVSAFSVHSILDFIKEHSLDGIEVLVPDSGPKSAIRNEAGQIIGVRSFILKRHISE